MVDPLDALFDALLDEHDSKIAEAGPEERRVPTKFRAPRPLEVQRLPAERTKKRATPLADLKERPLLLLLSEFLRDLDQAWIDGKSVKGVLARGRTLRYSIERALARKVDSESEEP